MGKASGQPSLSLKLVLQMAYATGEDAYCDLILFLCFDDTSFLFLWKLAPYVWAMGLRNEILWLNDTNNRLESINQKLKSVISCYSSLEEFFEKFFLILCVLRSEWDYKAALTVQRVPVVFHTTDSDVLIHYMKFLTHYAYHFVAKQVQLIHEVTVPEQDDDNYTLSSSECTIKVTPVSCTCSSFLSMKLPCWHIFAICSKLGFDLYDTSLCRRRWAVDYYLANQRVCWGEEAEDGPSFNVIDLPFTAK